MKVISSYNNNKMEVVLTYELGKASFVHITDILDVKVVELTLTSSGVFHTLKTQ